MQIDDQIWKTYKTINQSPVVAPVEAWVKCSKDASLRIWTALSLQHTWKNTNNVQTRRTDMLSAILLYTEIWPGGLGKRTFHIRTYCPYIESKIFNMADEVVEFCWKVSKNMPLVVMCGYPCSGKSKRAHELKNHLENSRGKTVHLAGDECISLERNVVYAGEACMVQFLLLPSPPTPGHDWGVHVMQ